MGALKLGQSWARARWLEGVMRGSKGRSWHWLVVTDMPLWIAPSPWSDMVMARSHVDRNGRAIEVVVVVLLMELKNRVRDLTSARFVVSCTVQTPATCRHTRKRPCL